MSMRKIIIGLFLVSLTAITPFYGAVGQEAIEYVPDSKTALAVATAIIKTRIGDIKYDQLTKEHDLEARLDGDVWSCFFYPRNVQARPVSHDGITEVTVVAGGALPVLKISKIDSKVIAFYYSK